MRFHNKGASCAEIDRQFSAWSTMDGRARVLYKGKNCNLVVGFLFSPSTSILRNVFGCLGRPFGRRFGNFASCKICLCRYAFWGWPMGDGTPHATNMAPRLRLLFVASRKTQIRAWVYHAPRSERLVFFFTYG